MIDWHCHILPAMDDGSKDVDESLKLVSMQTSQGVDTIIATPHFYADRDSVHSFSERREKSYEKLVSVLDKDAPRILLGAEIAYYSGISRLSELSELAIDKKRLLLIEMPMSRWSEYSLRELEEISRQGRFTVILAHIDRYIRLQSASVWKRLEQSGIVMQVNADFFTGLSGHKALSMLSGGHIHIIGSDCHNTLSRAPHMDKAYEVIGRKMGKNFVADLDIFGRSLLEKNER